MTQAGVFVVGMIAEIGYVVSALHDAPVVVLVTLQAVFAVCLMYLLLAAGAKP